MRILVTGATGVIGRRAVPMLVKAGHRVVAAGRNPGRLASLARTGAGTATLDIFDPAAVRRAVEGQDAVINLATHIPPSTLRMMLPGAWRENDRVRREGAANLAEAARDAGVGRFVQESFAPIYEDGGDRWLDESAPVHPVSYNRTVLDAERSAARFGEGGGVCIVLRFAGFYGPDAWHLHDMLKSMRRGIAPLPGRFDAFLSAISHDDAAAAVVRSLELPAGTYNVCDDEPLRRGEWFAAAAEAFGIPMPRPLPAFAARMMGSLGELLSRSQRMSNAKLRASGWAPAYPSVREGFGAIAEVASAA